MSDPEQFRKSPPTPAQHEPLVNSVMRSIAGYDTRDWEIEGAPAKPIVQLELRLPAGFMGQSGRAITKAFQAKLETLGAPAFHASYREGMGSLFEDGFKGDTLLISVHKKDEAGLLKAMAALGLGKAPGLAR